MASCLLRSVATALCVTELMAISTDFSANYPDFESWAALHGKHYATPEERFVRQYYFTKNVYAIENRKSATLRIGINKFADVSQEEFSARYLGYRPSTKASTQNDSYNGDIFLPESVDWVAAGAVTGVKNQGQCGSCWSFSTTGSVEGAWFLKTGDLISLSEQQLVDCSGPEGNQGCNGGTMDQAFEYIIKTGGICSETAYPYTASQGSCSSASTSTNCTSVAHISSYVDVQPKNDTVLMIAVAQQPVSVAVEANGLDWQFYVGGVVTDACGSNLDHGVLVVGYGTDSTAGDFWKVKNSWGPDWGEQGYIRIGRGSKFDPNGECGILLDPSYPVV